MLCVNADDYGHDPVTTDRILECYTHHRIHTASLMTFMPDSERATYLSIQAGLPVGLHLNFVEPYDSLSGHAAYGEHLSKTSKYLRTSKYSQLLFNPFLRRSFDYVFKAQWNEYCRLFNAAPKHLDGHHHMHLCANMIISNRLPNGLKIRRNFTFTRHEKSFLNRLYRFLVDKRLTLHYNCSDYFFSIIPIERNRLKRILSLSKDKIVELMVHPGFENEYRYLLTDDWLDLLKSRYQI
jgi:predicted glycoside hydrolase/deacetylase ChbG (UPF0249 family)